MDTMRPNLECHGVLDLEDLFTVHTLRYHPIFRLFLSTARIMREKAFYITILKKMVQNIRIHENGPYYHKRKQLNDVFMSNTK